VRTKVAKKNLEIEASKEWRRRTTAIGCRVCPNINEQCRGIVVGHHILRAQVIRRYASAVAHEQYLDADAHADLLRDLMWALPNGLGICTRAHSRHHSRIQPIALELIPLAAIRFAAGIGFGYVIEREYPSRERMTA
jgi:hypothetical protein